LALSKVGSASSTCVQKFSGNKMIRRDKKLEDDWQRKSGCQTYQKWGLNQQVTWDGVEPSGYGLRSCQQILGFSVGSQPSKNDQSSKSAVYSKKNKSFGYHLCKSFRFRNQFLCDKCSMSP
jgi:hypothetical protein